MYDTTTPQEVPGQDSSGAGESSPAVSDPGTVHVLVGAVRTRIVLSGEIDANLSDEFSDAMQDADATGLPVEVDAHHVTFMDSSGVAFLARLATRSPHKVRVLRAPATMRFLLDVTRIGELLEILDEDPGFELAPVDEFTIERLPRPGDAAR